MIATGWSGNVDFTRGNVVELNDLSPFQSADSKYSDWKSPSVKELRQRMREVFEGKYPYDTEAVSRMVRTEWTWDKAIDHMFERMEIIRERVNSQGR